MPVQETVRTAHNSAAEAAAAHREQQYRRYHERRAMGLCGKCDSPPVPGHALCERHRRDAKEAQHRVYHGRREIGACGRCGAWSETAVCDDCSTPAPEEEARV